MSDLFSVEMNVSYQLRAAALRSPAVTRNTLVCVYKYR